MLQDAKDPKIDTRPGNFLRLFHFYTVNRFHFKRKHTGRETRVRVNMAECPRTSWFP